MLALWCEHVSTRLCTAVSHLYLSYSPVQLLSGFSLVSVSDCSQCVNSVVPADLWVVWCWLGSSLCLLSTPEAAQEAFKDSLPPLVCLDLLFYCQNKLTLDLLHKYFLFFLQIVSVRMVCSYLAPNQCDFHTVPPSGLILITRLIDLLIITVQSNLVLVTNKCKAPGGHIDAWKCQFYFI